MSLPDLGDWDRETDRIMSRGVHIPDVEPDDRDYVAEVEAHHNVTFAIVYALGAAAGAGALIWKNRKSRSSDVSTDRS